MPKLKINGREIEVEAGTSLIEAARQLGVPVPHYCYHPGLSVAGSCRMCLVEVKSDPRLVASCRSTAAEGMVVSTDSDRVRQAKQGMLELLLVHHPLDCPVCDQAGECGLQDYYMQHGLHPGAMQDAKLVKSKKAFPIGDHILLDQERCILCSRCVRFTREVSRTGDLGQFSRGSLSVVDVAPGQRLRGNYTGNLADICPVGALLDRDFRFKCRVWYLGSVDSICPGCSRGCNIQIHFNASGRTHKAGGDRVIRLKPRLNPDVNRWWICDVGRYGTGSIDSAHRLVAPAAKAGGGRENPGMESAIRGAAGALHALLAESGPDALAVIASPQQTNEDLFLVDRLVRKGLGVEAAAWQVPPVEPTPGDDFLLRAVRNPNSRGAEVILGGDGASPEEGVAGRKGVVIFHHDLAPRPEWRRHLEKANFIIFIGPLANETSKMATWVLPSAVWAEKEGTFTNFQGRVQRIRRAVPPLGESLSDGEILQALAAHLEADLPGGGPEDLFEILAASVAPFQGMTYATLGDQGQLLKET